MIEMIKNLFKSAPRPDFDELRKNGAIVLDVRSAGEYQSGHVKGSVNIPLDQIGQKLSKIKSYNKPVITVCASGMRSGVAAGQLRKAGLEAYNGGSWHNLS